VFWIDFFSSFILCFASSISASLIIDSFASASSVLDALEVFKQPYIIQDYIETNATDIRVLVIGGIVVGLVIGVLLGRR